MESHDHREGTPLPSDPQISSIALPAHYFESTGLTSLVPHPLRRHLLGTLRANRYKTTLYRAEAARIVTAAADRRLPLLALHGIAWESALYGGTGARQFSDFDFLTTPD
ncbi:nucleotidyltransferase family protein [Spongiactinospora gelatinilytica]|uniref:nucleotidyltransferase family protein n=1 Tax=Spongiactinospora gelatinilytica TaxID=2666298 RepID=UPI001314B824|nr:nucleotidyltransferase family protein [Spongiactinospora gelatinilytica]